MSDINDFKDLIIWQKGWILLKDAISSLKFFPKMSCMVWFNKLKVRRSAPSIPYSLVTVHTPPYLEREIKGFDNFRGGE
jgi:hypothetical protein